MGKKQKKLHKDLERLLRGNRYWEWLALIDQGGLADQYPEQYETAWRTLIRKALRTPGAFDEFCERAQGLRRPARTRDRTLLPDYGFLMDLREFIRGKSEAGDLAPSNGLSPPARALRERAVSLDRDAFPEAAVRKLLKPFVENPRHVTKRQYHELAKVLKDSSMEQPVRDLGWMLVRLREMTGKQALEARPDLHPDDEFRNLDARCATIAGSLPAPLAAILFLPFCLRLTDFIAALPPERFGSRVSCLIPSLTFLFPLMAGEKAEAVQKELSFCGSGAEAIGASTERLDKAGFEDQVRMLGALRKAVKEQQPESSGPDPFSSLFEDEERRDPRRGALLALYEQVLGEIEQRKGSLGLRERRELAAVMDKIGAEDLPFLIEDHEDANQLAGLLGRFMRAGCLGKRTALLALMAAKRSRSPGLERSAAEVLNGDGPIEREDLLWILHEFSDLYLPRLRTLAPVMDRLIQAPHLWNLLIPELLSSVESCLITDAIMGRSRLARMLPQGMGVDGGRAAREIRDEVRQLGDAYLQLEPLQAFLSCFPKGWTREGFLCWLAYLRRTGNLVPYLVEKVENLAEMLEEDPIPFPFGMGHMLDLVMDQFAVLARFLTEHADDFERMDLDAARKILLPILPLAGGIPQGEALFIKVHNVLEKRSLDGDEAARPLADLILNHLRILARPRKASGRRRPGRRRS